MGEVMCFLIPFLQLFGMSASSGAILIIALDRYRSAVDTTMKRWNPNLWLSLAGISLLWTIAIGKIITNMNNSLIIAISYHISFTS